MYIKSNGISYPEAFDKQFFTEALEQGLNESNIEIESVSLEMGSAPGENYCSQIFRTKVGFKRKSSKIVESISLIIKSLLTGESVDFMEYMDCFNKERVMYTKILPVMEILLDSTKLAPICYYSQKLPSGFYVFEDLKAGDFTLANREKGLDINHCEIVLKKIAKFHAASMAFARKMPKVFQKFTEGILGKTAVIGSATLRNIFEGNLEELIVVSEQWPGFETITPKLQKFLNNYADNLIKTGCPRPGELCVLNHGDLWVNNIMFKYDEKTQKPIDAVFVDLSMSIYTSPGIDLNYFFNTSIPVDIINNKRQYFIKFYYEHLRETLEFLHYQGIPTYEQVLAEVANREDFGFFAASAILPIVSLEKSHCDDISCDVLADPDAGKQRRKITFASKRLQEQLKFAIKRFNDIGVLD